MIITAAALVATLGCSSAPVAGAWKLDTSPSQFRIAPRGQASQPRPVELNLQVSGGTVTGTAHYWRGDVGVTDTVRGSFAAQQLDLTLEKGGYRFQGSYDTSKHEITGKLIAPAPEKGSPVPTFRMYR